MKCCQMCAAVQHYNITVHLKRTVNTLNKFPLEEISSDLKVLTEIFHHVINWQPKSRIIWGIILSGLVQGLLHAPHATLSHHKISKYRMWHIQPHNCLIAPYISGSRCLRCRSMEMPQPSFYAPIPLISHHSCSGCFKCIWWGEVLPSDHSSAFFPQLVI